MIDNPDFSPVWNTRQSRSDQRFGHPPPGMPKTLGIWEWGCTKRGDAQNAVTPTFCLTARAYLNTQKYGLFVVYGNKEERKCDNRNVTETWSFAFRRGHMSRPWKTYIAYSTFLRRPHDQHDLNAWNRLWKTRSPYFRRRKLDGYIKQLYVSVEFTK